MSPETFAEVRALFDRVDELDPAAQERALERETGARPEVVAEVRRLLASEPSRLAPVESALNAALSGGAARMLGHYRLERILGEGGMGEVWLAEQAAPIRRKVAIKMIKAGMDTRQVIARFEAERQALATLSHPAVASVLDAGETALGRPYFVMEYVEGMPLDQYCDAHRLDTRARLKLFLGVCAGVQHAHNKTLVHRDLKPSNILVVSREQGPQPKIIDFGIATAIASGPEAGARLTEAGRPVGTPEYMSPEQLRAGERAVDTRSDVYSLGVTLCELLTGRLPQCGPRQGGTVAGGRGSLDRVTARPSALLRKSGTLGEAARRRSVSAENLLRTIRGDLDWIILKCIDPDPERRYDSPRALADDIGRFLDARPVLARAPTMRYVMSRFARRHRAAVTAGAAVALSLVIGIGAALASWQRALDAEQTALREAKAASEALGFVAGLLSAADPGSGGRATVNMLELVEQGARKLESGAIEDPLAAAQLAATLGDMYSKLSRGEDGLRWMQRAYEEQSRLLGPEHPETLKTAERITFAYWGYGPVEAGLALQERIVESYLRLHGPTAAPTLRAELMLGRILLRLGEVGRAEAVANAVMGQLRAAGRAGSPEAMQAGALLAGTLRAQRRFAESEGVLREVIEGRSRLLGTDHMDTAAAEQMLAGVLLELGRYDEAEALIARLHGKVLRAFGPGHKAEFRLMSHEALLRHKQGRLEEAAVLEQRVLAGFMGMLEPGHPDIALAARALAATLGALEREDEAEALLAGLGLD